MSPPCAAGTPGRAFAPAAQAQPMGRLELVLGSTSAAGLNCVNRAGSCRFEVERLCQRCSEFSGLVQQGANGKRLNSQLESSTCMEAFWVVTHSSKKTIIAPKGSKMSSLHPANNTS